MDFLFLMEECNDREVRDRKGEGERREKERVGRNNECCHLEKNNNGV